MAGPDSSRREDPDRVGVNRFAWDLLSQGPTPLAGEPGAEFRDRGPMVPPGTYQVRLTADGKSYTAPLELKMDPRVKASNEDVQKQNELGRKIVAQVSADSRGDWHDSRSARCRRAD